jgi:hypothetical protein
MEQSTGMEQELAEKRRLVRNSIDEVKKKFEEYPNIFLTEEDLRSHLFAELLKNGFSQTKPTSDNSHSIDLHSEVRWYGNGDKKMKCRSDIVVIDVSKLKVRGSRSYTLPSKGYEFHGFFTVIETKLRRINGESDAALLERIGEDIKKVRAISRKVSPVFDGQIVIFDKKKDVRNEVPANKENIEITYSFSDPASRNWEH